MAKPKKDPWSPAIAKAEAELASVERKLEGWQSLMQRRELLRNTIENLKVLRGKVEQTPQVESTEREGSAARPILWKQIVFAMQLANAPASPVDLALALRKSGRNDREMIRQALVRRTDVFQKLPDGRFTLKSPQTKLEFPDKTAEG